MLLNDRYILIKFMKNEYVNSFLDGNIYMNTLHYFWNEYKLHDVIAMKKIYMTAPPSSAPEEILIPIENNMSEYQEDILEGTITECRVTDENLRKHLLADMIMRSSGYQYCNVACFMKLKYIFYGRCVNYDIPDMEGFGDSVVIIDDERELLRRIASSVKKLGYKCLCGEVNYENPKLDDKPSKASEKHNVLLCSDEEVEIESVNAEHIRDCFVKAEKYSHQHEWRIALYRGLKDTNAYTLRLGNIRGIAHSVRASELVNDLDRMFEKKRVMPGLPGYHGNISRLEMRNLFHTLGDHKAKSFLIAE